MAADRHIVSTGAAPQPVGPYSQAVRTGNLLFVSGQLGLPPAGGDLPPDVTSQTRAALGNLKAVMEAAGGRMSEVVKTTCFLADMNDFAQFNAVYAEFFPDAPPARSCVAVRSLPKDALVEVEAIVAVS